MGRDKADAKSPISDIVKYAIPPVDYLTLEGEILMISPARAERLGGDPDSFVGRSIYEVEPDAASENRERIEKVVRTMSCQEFEDEVTGPSGPEWFLTSYQPVQGVLKNMTALQLVSINITERKRMELDLLKREAELRSLVNATRDAIIAADHAANIYVFNPAAERIFGYAKEEMIGQPFYRLMAEEWQSRHQGYWQNLDTIEDPHSNLEQAIELRGLRKDGTEFPMTLSVAFGDMEDQPFMITLIRDITLEKQALEERQRMELRLQEAQKFESLSVLAGGIAHDFNNLLTGILGNADLAKRRLADLSPARILVENIISASHRAADLTRQMLAYSGRGRFVIKAIDLNDMIRAIAPLLETSISKRAALRIELAKELPAVEVDVVQIQQILMNLIINASEAVAEKGGGTIKVSTGTMRCNAAFLKKRCHGDPPAPGRYVFLDVSDDGSGMDPQTAARIFEPFFSTKFSGRGLGLSAVLGIVRGHKGGIVIESEVGKGATFKVLLPARDLKTETVAEKDDPGDASPWRASGTVLLVDDEEAVRTTAAEMLRQSGFKVLMAVDGEEARTMLERHRDEIGCVLLDLTMPGMNGRETFDALTRIKGDLPIILTSGYSEEDVTKRFSDKKPAGFLHKPYDMATLEKLLRAILEPA